jgi:glutathione S-transferase
MIPARRPDGDPAGSDAWLLWASELSPFALKVDALLDHAGVPHRWLPAEGSRGEGLRAQLRVRRIVAGKLPLTFPEKTELDEFPLVPFLLGPNGENLYDSSAIGEWLDRGGSSGSGGSLDLAESGDRPGADRLLPDDPALRCAVRLVDEYFDEFGLYLVHHNRWVVSARDNVAGARLADDFRPLLGPLAGPMGRRFAARQVRRLPYLFSVAPAAAAFGDLPEPLRPPTRKGFPPTHALLEGHFARLLAALEAILAERPYLFGERFCLADASAYGQLAMNLSDPSAARWIERDAPRVFAWLARIAGAGFSASRTGGALELDQRLRPLLSEICGSFVPLMRQNFDAWRRHRGAGETRFNESAFDAGVALYDGSLEGHAFRSVAKTFQVRVWRSLREEWDALAPEACARLESLLPPEHGLDGDGTTARAG